MNRVEIFFHTRVTNFEGVYTPPFCVDAGADHQLTLSLGDPDENGEIWYEGEMVGKFIVAQLSGLKEWGCKNGRYKSFLKNPNADHYIAERIGVRTGVAKVDRWLFLYRNSSKTVVRPVEDMHHGPLLNDFERKSRLVKHWLSD